MEQTFQKSPAGCHRYLLRHIVGVVGQDHCVVCRGQKDTPLHEDDVLALLRCVQERTAHVKMYYYIPQSLSHYGEVDSLAPAGAMQDFVDYVQGLEKEEAEEFFRDLVHASEGWTYEISLIRDLGTWAGICKNLEKQYAKIFLFEPMEQGL